MLEDGEWFARRNVRIGWFNFLGRYDGSRTCGRELVSEFFVDGKVSGSRSELLEELRSVRKSTQNR